MRGLIARGDWAGLESEFGNNSSEVDPARADAIQSIDLDAYASELGHGVRAAALRVRPETAAVYWEFDVDNDWSSAFFFCESYRPESEGDDDWAAEFDSSLTIPGPSMPVLGANFAPTWNGSSTDAAVNAFLIARTVAAFGRASQVWDRRTPLCAGYHDQATVFRFRPPTE